MGICGIKCCLMHSILFTWQYTTPGIVNQIHAFSHTTYLPVLGRIKVKIIYNLEILCFYEILCFSNTYTVYILVFCRIFCPKVIRQWVKGLLFFCVDFILTCAVHNLHQLGHSFFINWFSRIFIQDSEQAVGMKIFFFI